MLTALSSTHFHEGLRLSCFVLTGARRLNQSPYCLQSTVNDKKSLLLQDMAAEVVSIAKYQSVDVAASHRIILMELFSAMLYGKVIFLRWLK